MDIQTEHMKHRSYFISAMCGVSFYTWCNYSLFDPINNSFYTMYYQNGLLFLLYLIWDTYHMIYTPKLFRTDLIIHHSVSFMITSSALNNNALQMSNYMILECVSLMNYIWRNNPQLLKLYRTICICAVRMPLTLWFFIYYNPTILFPHFESTLTPNHYLYLKTLYEFAVFFAFYDIFILWKLYKPITQKQTFTICVIPTENDTKTQ